MTVIITLLLPLKYAFGILTKKKTKEEVTLAMEIILEFHSCFDRYPKFIVSDYGGEFINNTLKKYVKEISRLICKR